jgi:trimeric autotransporter adhesin
MKTICTYAFVGVCAVLLCSGETFSQVENYFAGTGAGAGNTGSFNVFVGFAAGNNSNVAAYNTFLGNKSGWKNTDGYANTFIGSGTGALNTSGNSNTFVGSESGLSNTTARSNSFFGKSTGWQNETGANNAFFGADAGYNNITGSTNAFFGYYAGRANKASDNTYIGGYAGVSNSTGTLNTFVGRSAGYANNIGGSNTFVGSMSGDANTSGGNNTFVGQNAGGANTTGNRNSFLGIGAGELTTTGHDNTFIGRQAGRNNVTGSGNTAIGNYAVQSSAALTNTVAIGNKAIVRTSNSMVLGSINGENSATVTMNVGIGTSSPAYNLHVNGTAAKPGGGSWTVASDRRLKKNIRPFAEGLDEVNQIKPVWFEYNGKAGMPTGRPYVGVIAQDMQKIAPHTISEFTYDNGEGQVEQYLDYDANALTYSLVNAVQELSAELTRLKEEIALLKKQIPGGGLSEGSAAKLWQNAPNPYNATTAIRYYVPEEASDARITIISMTGQEVYSRQLTDKGDSQIEVSNQLLSSGTYIYQLVVDGKVVDKKKMVLSK